MLKIFLKNSQELQVRQATIVTCKVHKVNMPYTEPKGL